MSVLAYDYDRRRDKNTRDELLDGKLMLMSPTPHKNHNAVTRNISALFTTYLRGKECVVVVDPFDVVLSDKDRVRPDVMVVCDKSKIKDYEMYGAPDLVVEVLSPSTEKNDTGYKMRLYALSGVKEYWIVRTTDRSVSIYLPVDGRYELADFFVIPPYYELEKMTEEERASLPKEFSPALFPGMTLALDDVFDGVI